MDYYLLRWELNRKQLKYVTLTGLGKPSEYTLNLFMALYEVKAPKKALWIRGVKKRVYRRSLSLLVYSHYMYLLLVIWLRSHNHCRSLIRDIINIYI